MNKCLRNIFLALASAALVQAAFGNETDTIKEALKKKYPSTVFTSIQKTPIPGIYEAVMGRNVAYTDSAGRYLIFGRMMDMQTQRDLTGERLAELHKVDFNALPLDKAIKITRGNGKRAFAVFTDPDCPYCQSLEREGLKGTTDYTMYVFPYPIASLHPDARRKSIDVLCAYDKASAWTNLMVNRVEAPSATCDTPIEEFIQLARTVGVDGTPTMIRADGVKAAGAMPAARLDAWLNGK